MKARGFGLIELLIAAAAVSVVAALFWAAYKWVDNHFVTSAGIAHGRKLATDELQPKLDTCTSDLAKAHTAIQAQNAAIDGLRKESEAKTAAAAKQVAEAVKANAGVRTEIARLGNLIDQPVAGPCPAATAVRSIREGLRP